MNAIQMIEQERKRQIAKGFDAFHDNTETQRQLARAAECHLHHYTARAHTYTNELNLPGIIDGPKTYRTPLEPRDWPWDDLKFKTETPIKDLVKAAALIVAEIERLQRAEQKASA